MSFFPKISFQYEVEEYLTKVFRNKELITALGTQEAENKYQSLLCHLSHPPRFTTVRVNTHLASVKHVKKLLFEEIQKQFKGLCVPVLEHPKLQDILLIPVIGPRQDLKKHPSEVIVGAQCGYAVLRGAHVYVPGIVSTSRFMKAGDLVSVYSDIEGKCKRGAKEFDGVKVFLGNGISELSRSEIFSSTGPLKGPQNGCGGYLSTSASTFGPPVSNVTRRYEKNLNCVWIITAPVNKLINLTFTSFELEAQSAQMCRYDYVKLYDGDNENANLVGTFCGSRVPAPFISTHNSLTVQFVTDNYVERGGFNATYTTVDRLCGGIYNATSTSLTATSPNFPNEYPPFTICTWVIDAPPQQQVRVVVEAFYLHSSQDCSQNYLELQDSPTQGQGTIHRFCGTETFSVPEFYSYDRTAIVTFKSDEYMINNGVRFSYQATGCSREYNQTFGYLKSPGWPGPHPNNMECSIILRAPPNHTISLFFHAFSLEDSIQCSHDFLEVRNGSDVQSPLLGRFCGNTVPSPIFPQNHVVYLHFKSDFSGAHDGYEITWTSSPSGCGGTLYGTTGSFASPRYPATYHNNTYCEWAITAPQGRIVTVNFDFISIDDPGDCSSNYLILYNGPDASHPPAGPYCGTDTNIAPFTATSHQVYIKFHAEYVTLPSGFQLSWTS